MTNVHLSKEIAERVRLSEDKKGIFFNSDQLSGREIHKDWMLRNGLLISEAMTPQLESSIQYVCSRLLIPRSNVTAFVYNDSDVQADCVIDKPETCVLRFTSGLVNLMDEKELQFVIAHELGHFLLGHGACSNRISDGSTEGFMLQRARELSADRIGFLGMGSLDKSIQAIIKTASGLNNEFLRFDVSSFMSQTAMLSKPHLGEARNSTHPSMLIRCRALLWFSMTVANLENLKNISDAKISAIDIKVTRDLEKYVDGQVRARKKELFDDITLWKYCSLIVSEGEFTKNAQMRFSKEMGELYLNGLKTFLDSHDANKLATEALQRMNYCIKTVFKEFPSSADEIETAAIQRAYLILAT